MYPESELAFTAIAALFIATPGPAVLLALRNGIQWGMAAAAWSSLGNITGVFCLSLAAMLGLGLLLQSSEALFAIVRSLGAIYFLWVGVRWVFSGIQPERTRLEHPVRPVSRRPHQLYVEALLVAVVNPTPVLFFTALFPQFISQAMPLMPQFYLLTSTYMALSFCTLMAYALAASRARHVLQQPHVVVWVNRLAGGLLVAFGLVLLWPGNPLTLSSAASYQTAGCEGVCQ